MLLDDMRDKFPGLAEEMLGRPHAQRTRQAVPHCELDRETRVMIFPRTPVLGEALREWGDQKTIVHLMARFSNHDVRVAAHHAARRATHQATRAMAALPAAPADRPAREAVTPSRMHPPAPPRRPARRPTPPPSVRDTVPVFIPRGQEDPDKSFWGEEEPPKGRRWYRKRRAKG